VGELHHPGASQLEEPEGFFEAGPPERKTVKIRVRNLTTNY
jgi:hypothetical protein